MNKEEVNAEFANVELKFHSYFKYSFTFVGTSDTGRTIEAVSGGFHEDIYRYEVKAADAVPFKACDEWRYVRVFDGGTEVFYWHDDR